MPDFDKNLQPIIKDSSIPFESVRLQASRPAPQISAGSSDFDLPTLANNDEDVFKLLNKLSNTSNFQEKGMFVTNSTLKANKRYDTFNPIIADQEDFAAYNQGTVEKAFNGTLKGLNLVGTTVAGGFGMLLGTAKWAMPGGKFSDIWDNPVMQGLDEWNTKVDQEYLPNYYTNKEKQADWYDTDNWMTSNFLFDKIVKNSGFAVGAMVSGNIANGVLGAAGAAIGSLTAEAALLAESSQAFKLFTPLLRNTSRAFSAGKNIQAAGILEKELSSIADITTRSSKLSQLMRSTNPEIAELAKTVNSFAKFNDSARRTAIAAYSSAGEASFEALQTSNEFRKTLIDKYVRQNGTEPTGAELQNINDIAGQVGATSFIGNLALLSVTEFNQLPNLLGSSYKTTKTAANGLLGKVDDVLLKEGKYVADVATPTTRFGKLFNSGKRISGYAFDPKEGAQEIGQYALQVGTQHYFEKGKQNKSASDVIDSVLESANYAFFNEEKGALRSKEGIEGGIIGAFTGGVMQTFGPGGTLAENREKKTNTVNFINGLNNAPSFQQAFVQKMQSVNRGVELQQQYQAAVIQGDKLEAMDARADMMHNYLTSRINYGRFDMVMEDIAELKQMGITKEGLDTLKEQGIGNINDTVESFQKRLTGFETVANNTNEIIKATNLRFSGETVTDESGKSYRKYSPIAIDKLVYAASKIADYDVRLPQVMSNLSSNQISISSILASITENGKPSREALDEALKQINDLDVLSTVKDDLKTNLSEVVELSMRRKQFMEEYDGIKRNPLNYESVSNEGDNAPVVVSQKEKVEGKTRAVVVEKELEIGRPYSLKEILRKDGTELQFAPKITILSKTLAGEYEVQLPNGKIKFLTPTEFKNYNISDEENLSDEMSDILNKAIDDVLNTSKFSEIEKPTGNKLSYINSLDDQSLINAIEKEFNKQAAVILQAKQEAKERAERLLKNKETLDRELAKLAPTSGDVETVPTPADEFVGTREKAKDIDRLFLATISPSESKGNEATNNLPHIKRARTFLNNFKFFKNRNDYKVIVVTPKNAKELGLEGIVQVSYNMTLGDTLTEKETNVNTGFMAQVFIMQTPEGNFYVNDKGEKLSKVGEESSTILDNVIFQTMSSAELETTGGYNKVREGQEEEAQVALEAYKIFRQDLSEETGYTPYPFAISRGIPNQNVVNGVYENNNVADILGPNAEDIIATHDGLITVVTSGKVEHEGELLSFPLGSTLIQYGDLLDFVNNKTLTNKQANNVFAVMNAMAKDLIDKSESGKIVKPNFNYLTFLRNVLYFKFKGNPTTPSQISLDTTAMAFRLGNKSFPFSEIEQRKQEITDALQEAFISVNNKTLTEEGTSKKFTEYVTDAEGNLSTVTWPNYQSYLLSGKNPDGSSRSSEETPLITHTSKPTENQNSYKQKYAYITDKNVLPYDKVPAREAKPAPVENKNKIGEYEVNTLEPQTFPINSGPILFTATLSPEGEVGVTVQTNQTISDLSTDPVKIKTIDSSLRANLSAEEIEEFDKKSNEDKAKLFIGAAIKQSLTKTLTEQAPAPVVEAPVVEEVDVVEAPYDPSKRTRREDTPEYRRVGRDNVDRMTDADYDAFKEWHAATVPLIPFEVLDNMVTTHDGEQAWGVFENGVAKFVRGGLRGTEYHEVGHGIWKMLPVEEQDALLNEFKSKTGTFKNRQSGKEIAYADATDIQAEERMWDDFSDYRVGKLPARTLGEKVRKLFKMVMDFFKSFVTKPSLKEQLFKAIDAGRFKETQLSEAAKALAPKYRAIEGLTEEQTNNYIQDMVFQVSRIIFREGNKDALFNPEKLTGNQVFDQVREKYEGLGEIDALGEKRYNELVKKTIDSIRTRGISFNAEEVVSINDENTTSKDYAPEAFSTDWKKHSTGALKFLLSTLAERKALNQTNVQKGTELKPSAYSLSNQGYKLLNFNRVFATLLDRLHNTNDPYEFTDKFIQLAKEDSNYIPLFVSLGGNVETHNFNFSTFGESDWKLFIQFFNTFSKQKPNALIQYTSEEGDVYTGPANLFTNVSQTIDGWIANMKTIGKGEGGLISYSNKEYKIDTEKISNINIKKSGDQIKFLNQLGIEFDQGTYNGLSSKQAIINGKNTTEVSEFADAVGKIHKYLGKNNNLMTFDGKRLDITGPLRTLSTLYNRVNNPNQDSTYFGVEGQRIGAFSENNAPSYFENTFNESKTLAELLVKMPQLNDIYSKGSELLKPGGLFFDKKGNRIAELKVGYIQGSKNQLNGKDQSTSKLTRGQRYVQEINQNINGNYYVLIPGDSSTEWMMNLGNVISMDDVMSGDYLNKMYAIYSNYLNDDINLALEDRKQNIYTRAKSQELRIMRDILPENIVSGIEGMIKDGFTYDDIQGYISENRQSINDSVKQFTENMTNETVNTLLNSGQILSDGEGYILNKFDTDFLKKYNLTGTVTIDDVRNVMLFANINYQINNQEYHKILFGDPYQFKTEKGKLDETKRIKSFLSPRRRTFNMTEFNNFLKDKYNSVDDVKLKDGMPGHHAYKSYTNTVTLNTVQVVGSIATLPNLPKEIKDQYAKTDETDAMSWLMDNTHKEIAVKEGQWSNEAEAFHQWQMAYTRQAFLKKNLFKTEELKEEYKNSPLNEKDAALVLTKMPKHKLAIRKPIVSGNKFDKREIDLVLDKTSQMPLYYNMVEGTNLEKLYVQMFNQNIGYSIVTTGRKVGAEGLHDVYNADGTFNATQFENIVEVPWIAYGTQVETMSEGEKTQTRGSQLTKLASSDLYENGEAITPEGKQAYERNTKILDLLNENAYNELLNKLGVVDLGDGYALEDNKRVSETLMYEMMRRDLSENAKDTIQLDENGQFPMPFEASPSYGQIKSILYSMVNKALISPAMNGAPHVQAPVTMFEEATKGRSFARKTETGWEKITKNQYKALTEEEKKSVLLTDDTLKFYEDKEGKRYCEVMLPHWFKNKFGNMTGDQILEYLNTDEGRKILTGIGFRIPTQALSSVEVFRVKGFLPQYMGYTVIVPSEITTKAGSDFDIDKLNMYLKSVYTDRNGNVKLVKWQGSEEATKDFFAKVYDDTLEKEALSKVELIEAIDTLVYGLEDTKGLINKYGDYILSIQDKYDDPAIFRAEIEKELDKLTDDNINGELRQSYINNMYKKSLENEYYDSLEELLTLPENFNRLISPVNDGGLEKISEVLDDARGYNEANVQARLVNRNYMTDLRHAFITGKRWVGIAAVNITNLSLRQKSKVYLDPSKLFSLSGQESKFVQDLDIILPHNKIDVEGQQYVSLSGTKTSDGKQLISERLSGYATAFVDIANKPFITKIIKSDTVVSTFMFLEAIGAGNTGIYFLNQPIIEKYLEYLDNVGSKNVAGKMNLEYIRNQFPTTSEALRQTEISVEQLLDNIKEYSEKGEFDARKNAEQQLILNEFVKYKVLADQLFTYTQSTNYDTTRFGSSDALLKKEWATFNASNFNLISNVDEVLTNTFIGRQAELLSKAFGSFGAIMKTELPEIKAYTISTLKRYATRKYMSSDDYEKIANLIKNSFIDYVIQNNTTMSNMVKPLLVDSETAVVNQLEQAKQKYPSIKILQDLIPAPSNREGGANSIELKANVKDAYSENLYVGMMRELRDTNPELNALYNNIVNVAILQGVGQSAISIRNIIPVEDYAAKIAPIIEQLRPAPSLNAFENGMFERNNFNNKDVVAEFIPYVYTPVPNNKTGEYSARSLRMNPNTGEDELVYFLPAFKELKGVSKESRKLVVLNGSFNAFQVGSDFIKIPKVVTNKEGLKINVATGLEVTAKDYALMKQKGSQDLYDAYYYQKVYTKTMDQFGNAMPLITLNINKNTGDLSFDYYYKQINMYGDGNRAVEFNKEFKPSAINNGAIPNVQELSDEDIVNQIAPQMIAEIVEQVVSLQTEQEVAPTETVSEKPEGITQEEWDALSQEEKNKIKEC
jgi:hypothetical protein